MLEVRAEHGCFVLFGTDGGQSVMRFDDCLSSDQMVAELKAGVLPAPLERWARERVPTVC